ncbi:hypothetical protein Riv7116_3683 [Rivularia sp. PCC 7116]|uniref:hypothetical protein n=1 Tax=Rivularia sp. PCC 7116 TaxID=373994 RepID=UPI00029F0398|nr:hypothetical protein [Rivularia sp. PCC 7116]AFY56132.1 hypothetical protein Riv7116_3683 [Rivularia sp. PCC 7116]
MTNQTKKRFQWSPKIIFTIAFFGFLFGLYFIFTREPAPTPGLMSVSKIAREKDDLIGKFVTIRSKYIEKLGPTSFAVRKRKFFIKSKPVIIINASGKVFDLPSEKDTEVQVTGTIRQLDIPKLEKEFNLRLQDKVYEDYKNGTAIVAQHIALAPEVNDIADNPKKYYNRRLALTGEIENIKNPKMFTLDEDDLLGEQDLLVLNPTPAMAVNNGQTVAVTGVVRPFRLAELEKDYKLTWNSGLKKEMELKYKEKPVLIADTVYPSRISTLD